MTDNWLYLPIEVATRETDAKLLLAYYAIKQNYNVVFGDQYEMVLNAKNFPQGIFLSKGHTTNNFRFAFNVKDSGHTVVELDEEALFLNKTQYIGDRTNEQLMDTIEQMYCWGKNQKDLLVKIYPHYKMKFHLTGHPRFDLLNEKFQKLYQDQVHSLRTLYGDYILINTRFVKYNHPNGFNERYQEFKNLYESFIQMIKILSDRYKNLNIIVRPHPAENHESYQEELSGCKNVLVINEGTIVKWILASKLVIHNGCTTGIESFLCGRPAISYMPNSSEKIDEDLPNELSHKALNMKEMLSLVDFFIRSNEAFVIEKQKQHLKEKLTVLSGFYEAIKGHYAYENIIHLLSNIKKNELNLQRKLLFLNKLYQGRQDQNKIIITREKIITEIYENDIHAFFNKLNMLENEKKKIKIQNFNRHLFVFQKE
jgi:surface carbohydrate biosynthesis protein